MKWKSSNFEVMSEVNEKGSHEERLQAERSDSPYSELLISEEVSKSSDKHGRGHGIKKAKKVIQESSAVKSKKSLVTMLNKAKPEATLLANGPLAVGDPVEVKESGVVHECRVVQVAEDLVQVHYQGWNARYDTWVRYPGSSRQALRDRTNKVLEEIVPYLALKSKTKLNEASRKTIEMKDVEVKPEIKVKEEKKYVKTNPGLSEYELIRLGNMRQREALFAELNLDAAKVEASPRIERTVSAPSRYVMVLCSLCSPGPRGPNQILRTGFPAIIF